MSPLGLAKIRSCRMAQKPRALPFVRNKGKLDFSQLANGFGLSVKLRMVIVSSKEAFPKSQFPGLLAVN